MKRNTSSPYSFQRIVLLMITALTVGSLFAQKLNKDDLLEDKEYRSDIEEVVVVGSEPEWRKNMDKQEEWRPERLKLSDNPSLRSRVEWFPEYTKEERDNYQGVRDRTGENPEFQIFKMKF